MSLVYLTLPVTNAWPEHGAITVKQVKSCTRSTMKNDLLNALLNILINGPAYNSKEAKQLNSEAAMKFESSKRQKSKTVIAAISNKYQQVLKNPKFHQVATL